MAQRIKIEFNNKGEGKMNCVGLGTFQCLGKRGLMYPKDLTLDPSKKGTKTHPHYSREYVCDYPGEDGITVERPCLMNYSILIWGQRGIYIHEWPGVATFDGNGGETGGCIHLQEGDAKNVYNWVKDITRITMNYPWLPPSR